MCALDVIGILANGDIPAPKLHHLKEEYEYERTH